MHQPKCRIQEEELSVGVVGELQARDLNFLTSSMLMNSLHITKI